MLVHIAAVAAALRPTPTALSDRRAVLRHTAALAGAAIAVPPHLARADALPDYAGVKAALMDMVKADPDIGPTMIRLAWHSSGTYDKMSKTGGSQAGTIRFKEELAHGANAGLDKMVAKLEPIHKSHPDVSYADLYTLAGVSAIEAAGGPKIAWRAGRADALTPDAVTPNGRLPDADVGKPSDNAAHLRTIFGRMGFNDQQIVALSGAHALGRCHPDASGYSGPWTPTPTCGAAAQRTARDLRRCAEIDQAQCRPARVPARRRPACRAQHADQRLLQPTAQLAVDAEGMGRPDAVRRSQWQGAEITPRSPRDLARCKTPAPG